MPAVCGLDFVVEIHITFVVGSGWIIDRVVVVVVVRPVTRISRVLGGQLVQHLAASWLQRPESSADNVVRDRTSASRRSCSSRIR